MLIIAGRLHVAPDARDLYLAGCAEVVSMARQAVGCLDFSLSADLLDATRINIHEQWESDEDLHRFRGSGPDAEQAAKIIDADVRKYRISAVEDP